MIDLTDPDTEVTIRADNGELLIGTVRAFSDMFGKSPDWQERAEPVTDALRDEWENQEQDRQNLVILRKANWEKLTLAQRSRVAQLVDSFVQCSVCGRGRKDLLHRQTAAACAEQLGRPCGEPDAHHPFQEPTV